MLKKLWILTIFRFSNNFSESRMSRALNRFAMVEADSAWQLLKALEFENHEPYRAKLFINALEEVHHAFLFKSMANKFTRKSSINIAARRDKIYISADHDIRFKVAHYLGEKNVYGQFLSYANAIKNEEVKNLFLGIRGDEEEHQHMAYLHLKEKTGIILREYLDIAYNDFVRFGKSIGDFFSGIIIFVLYFIGGVFFGKLCRRIITLQSKRKYLEL
jgi:hypothetical protein